MPDFNIKFKYEGAGKSAKAARTNAISASQRNAASKASQGGAQIGQNRELVSSIKTLTTTIKSLERAVKSSRGLGGGGGGGGISSFGGTGGGLGKIGAALGIAGAPIAAMGFAIQKINQVGNAYISLVSQQASTVGVGGFYGGETGGKFRATRRGMYLQTEQGAMSKAHRMAAGRFSGEVSDRAVQVGSIFGMGAEEIGRVSGMYARSGGNMDRAVSVAAGSGIQTELPLFLQGMSSILEEAVTNGVNSSTLANDIGDQVSVLTQRSGTNSVAMAMNVLKSFRGVQSQVGRGQISGVSQFATYRAAGAAINQRLANPNQAEGYLTDLRERGILSSREISRAQARANAEGRPMTLADLSAQSPTIEPILRRQYVERHGADTNRATVEELRRNFGSGEGGTRRILALNAGFGETINQQALSLQAGQPIQAGAEARGSAEITNRFNSFEGSSATMGLKQTAGRNAILMKHGGSFAQTAMEVEKSLISLADTFAPSAEKIKKVGEAATATAEALVGIKKWFDANFTPGAPQQDRSILTASPEEIRRRVRRFFNMED